MPTYTNSQAYAQYAIDLNGSQVSVAPGAEIQTYKRLDASLWTLVSEAPYHKIAVANHTVTASGAGWESQTIALDSRVIDIYAGVEVTIHANAKAAPGLRVQAEQHVQIKNDQEIETLWIYFGEAGAVDINELTD